MGRVFHIMTMGCQMNDYDSDLARQILVRAGHVPAADPDTADLVLINTCAVRQKAEQKAFSLLGRVLQHKKRKPETLLVLMGCIAQREGALLLKRFPELNLILGTREIPGLAGYIRDIETGSSTLVATRADLDPPCAPNTPGYFRGRVTSHVSIMEGCNNFCSYCVVPYVRGREVSRNPEEILLESRHLVSDGVREITLLGQNVNSYSHGLRGDYRFPSLLRALSRMEGLIRVRFTTSHPKDLSSDLIRCFAELANLCPHIHLPFQSGSNKVLRRMKRGYTREAYMEKITQLREVLPEIAITSDVMVGFPGETESDFLSTMELIQQIQFDNLYSFKYSDRKGTRAETMKGKIEEKEKSLRLAILQKTQKQITLSRNEVLEGTQVEVLVDSPGRRENQLTGRTPTNKIVNFNSNYNNIGYLTQVIIERSSANSLFGRELHPTDLIPIRENR